MDSSEEMISRANLTRFIQFVNKKHGKSISDYPQLYDWSITEISDFWAAMWEFADIIHSKTYDQVVDDPGKMPGAKWFSGAELNFAENLLRYSDDRTALVFKGETKDPVRYPIRICTG